MTENATLNEALEVVRRLSTFDKISLLEHVASSLKDDLAQPHSKPLETFKGILAPLGAGPSDEDIDAVRRAMWAGFPREDV
jgi:hypothetical protein